TTPVALITGRRELALLGSDATATSATSSGWISPRRARSWTATTTSFTTARPRVDDAATSRGSASTASVRGMLRRLSAARPAAPPPPGRRGGRGRQAGGRGGGFFAPYPPPGPPSPRLPGVVAEGDGNRTRLARLPGHSGF